MRAKIVLIVLSMLLLSACSNKSLYQSIQNNRTQNCDSEVHPSKREDCLDGLGKSHERYERERQELLKTTDQTRATTTP